MLCTTTNALQTLSTENAESSTPEQKHGSDTLKALYCSNVLLDDKMLLVFRVMQWGFIDWLRYLICNGNWSNINLNVHFLLVCMFKAGTMLLSLWLLCFIISYIQLTLRCISCLHKQISRYNNEQQQHAKSRHVLHKQIILFKNNISFCVVYIKSV